MAGEIESEKLLSTNNVSQICCSKKIRFFVSIGIVLIFFKGSESMEGACFKQYVYYWCRQYLNKTSETRADNGASANTSESGGCSSDQDSKSDEDRAQTLASQWTMYYEILSAVLVFISTSFYGTLSDYVGRKKIGCLSLFGFSAKCAIVAVVIRFDLHIAYFLVAYAVDGLCGSYTTFSLYSYSSSADVTNNVRERVFGIALLETMMGLGSLTTDILNGYFIHQYGYFYPMLTATSGGFFSFALACILLKETGFSHDADTQIQNIPKYKTTIPSCGTLFKNYVGFYVGKDQSGKKIFWLCLVVFFLLEFVIFSRSSVITLYQLARPFCWSSETIGWYGGAYIFSTLVIGIIAMKPILHVLPEDVTACVGVVSSIAFNVITALSTSTLGLFIAVAAGFLMYLPKSIIRGIASSRAMDYKQGAIFAGLQSSELICKLLASPLSLSLYSHTLDSMSGALFLILAGFCVVALVLMIWVGVLLRKEGARDDKTVSVEYTENTQPPS